MNINNFNIDDCVIAKTDINSIQSQSVGIIIAIKKKNLKVHFVGADRVIECSPSKIEYLDIKKTGKPYDKKICNVCHILKDRLKDFSINQTDAYGRKTTRPTCKKCRVKIDGKPIRSTDKISLIKKRPKGIFKCPICNKTSIPGFTANLVMDHDHITGGGREWICDSCNTGLGRFKDDIEILKKAIEYLKKYS